MPGSCLCLSWYFGWLKNYHGIKLRFFKLFIIFYSLFSYKDDFYWKQTLYDVHFRIWIKEKYTRNLRQGYFLCSAVFCLEHTTLYFLQVWYNLVDVLSYLLRYIYWRADCKKSGPSQWVSNDRWIVSTLKFQT